MRLTEREAERNARPRLFFVFQFITNICAITDFLPGSVCEEKILCQNFGNEQGVPSPSSSRPAAVAELGGCMRPGRP